MQVTFKLQLKHRSYLKQKTPMYTLIFRTLMHITAQVGDVVARCDFDNVVSNDDGSLLTGCRDIDFAYYGEARFITDSSSDSADTGPSADHTGDGGKLYN